MIVYCEECGHKNIIKEDRLIGKDLQILCEQCGDPLQFYGIKAKALKKTPLQPPQKKDHSCLILKYGAAVFKVNRLNPRMTIGRQKNSDIQVLNNRVSREHARIEYRYGKFYLLDQSSNGTYLLIDGRKGVALRRKEILLTANGVIGPGYKVEANAPEGIHFRFENLR